MAFFRPIRLAFWLLALALVQPAAAAGAPAAPQAATTPPWVTSWEQPMTSTAVREKERSGSVRMDESGHPVERAPTITDATLRQQVLLSAGGQQLRITVSNYFGQRPLTVSAARLARSGADDDAWAIDAASDRSITFRGGDAAVTVAPGGSVTSDPVQLSVPALSRLTVSLYFAHATALADMHPLESARTTVIASGNHVGEPTLTEQPAEPSLGKGSDRHVYLLTDVQVQAPARTRGIVAFGDSITDGAYATGLDKPWPEALATLAARHGQPAAVANAAISGNELTTDQIGRPGEGPSGLKRFERDVIDRPGVTDVLVLFGANDINRGIDAAGYPNGASSGDLIASLRMLIDVAHQHHLRIYGGTITPFAGFPNPGWYSPAKEAVRQRVNQWIRNSGAFDGAIDLAAAVRGPYRPAPLAARQQPMPPGMANACAGDAGLHPNDRGYQAMAVAAYNVLFKAQLQPAQPCAAQAPIH